MRRNLSNLLTSNGHEVVGEAGTGSKAVQLFEEKRPSIVTMDLNLPEIDGYEATRMIRRIDPDAKVIIISDVLERSVVLGALSAGAVDFLVKPVHVDRLLQVIEGLFEQPPTPAKV
jgi:two-component system chemotaxis response regulator CheY